MRSTAQLIEKAVARTGLSDFGGDDWREGLDRLVASLNEEADLTGLGEKVIAYRVRRLPSINGRPTETFPFRLVVPTGESTPSLARIWAGADWQEREQFDLVGTIFGGHPDLRRLMMPED